MTNQNNPVSVSVPGRICLFGEHQDYLHLPVIPMAISLRISIIGARTDKPIFFIDLPDLGESESMPVNNNLEYIKERDYLRSAINTAARAGAGFSTGFNASIQGNIPINSGTSSSSALIAAFIMFLTRICDTPFKIDPVQLAKLAHQAEVLEFNEPGGMMDHFSTACGGVIFLDFEPDIQINRIHTDLQTFVLGDSKEPKDTKGILSRVKTGMLNILQKCREEYPGFSLRQAAEDQIVRLGKMFSAEEAGLLKGTWQNYQITMKAAELLKQKPLDHQKIGSLLNEHQAILRDKLKISTPKINRMLDAALKAGAYGGKINGSGGGGCMFVYAPNDPESAAQAIRAAGGKAYTVESAHGVEIEKERNL